MFLEYSQTQKAFHIIEEDEMLDTNREAFANGSQLDYIPVFKGTHEECMAMSKMLRERYGLR